VYGGGTSSLNKVLTSTVHDTRVPEDDFKKSSTDIWRDTESVLSFRISSQQARIFIIPCPVAASRCSFQSMSSNTDASFNNFILLSDLRHSHGLLLRSLSFVKGALLPNFNQTVQEVQQPKNIFSISHSNLCACFNKMSLEQKT